MTAILLILDIRQDKNTNSTEYENLTPKTLYFIYDHIRRCIIGKYFLYVNFITFCGTLNLLINFLSKEE